jgi:nitrogen fixation/metabolism regulation signal transduction histidine kinase
MLRRKLLIRIGLLVACFVAGAVVAIYLLQDTIPDIERINRDAVVLVDGVHTAGDCIADIVDARDGLAADRHLNVNQLAATLSKSIAAVGSHAAVSIDGSPQTLAYQKTAAILPAFLDPAALSPAQVIDNRAAIRASVRELATTLRAYLAAEQARFGRRFRWLVLGLTIAALLMVNIAVFVLLRTAQVVLKPVSELVRGSRELAAEHFEHRVKVEQQDEFGELARAYNRLAEQLQANEERKAETLRQLAVTLNHDLNNAMATIEMQLSLLDRQSGSSSALARYFRDIQSTLTRMSQTVSSLKHIRRVVLTDYVDGQKMVDLERSVVPPTVPPSTNSLV